MLWGTFSFCLSAVVLAAVFLGARHPSKPKWAGDLMVQYVWVIVILGLGIMGLVLVIFAFSSDAPAVTAQEYLWSLALAAGTAASIKLLGLKKKLAAYAAGHNTA